MPAKKKIAVKKKPAPRELKLDMMTDTVRAAVFNAVISHVLGVNGDGAGTGHRLGPDGRVSLVVSFGVQRFMLSVRPMMTEGRA